MATLTNAGLLAVAKLINGVDSLAAFTYMATGTGSTAEANTDTALGTENSANGSARAAATCSYVADYVTKWVKTFTFTGPVTVREIGILNDASAGTLLIRHVLTADKVYGNGESIEIEITNTSARAT